MQIPQKAIENLMVDMKEDIAKICESAHSKAAIAELADIVRILEYSDKRYVNGENSTVAPMSSGGGIDNYAKTIEEMDGAHEYYTWFKQTGDKRYLAAARQEMAHAGLNIAILEERGENTSALKTKLQQLEKVIM